MWYWIASPEPSKSTDRVRGLDVNRSATAPRTLRRPTILLAEHVCGGGWIGKPVPQTLAGEAVAMLVALANDLAERFDVVCPIESRFTHAIPPKAVGVKIHADWQSAWSELAKQCDRKLIIAPESDQQLDRAHHAVSPRSVPGYEGDALVRLTSDKLRLAEYLAQRGIPHPDTFSRRSFQPDAYAADDQFCVKPSDGCGGEGVRLNVSATDAATLTADQSDALIQRFVAGRAFSIGAIANGRRWIVLPTATLNFSDGEGGGYLGGEVPVDPADNRRVKKLVGSVIKQLPPPPRGWIGFDVVLGDDDVDHLIEINPRLCTSFIGMRRCFGPRLALSMVDEAEFDDWFDDLMDDGEDDIRYAQSADDSMVRWTRTGNEFVIASSEPRDAR